MAKAAESKKNIESLGQLSLPPHSTDAEAALIGGLLLDSENQAYDKIADIVSERDFYHTENKEVFKVIQSLSEESKVTDLLTVSDYLDSSTEFEPKPSIEYLSEIVESTAGNSNITEYAKIIREKALLRELIQISSEIAQSAYKPEGKSPSELVDIAESHIFEIAERGNRNMVFAEMSDLVKQTYDELDKRSQGGGNITGVSSGFRELDNLTAGLQNGELIIIAGRPSMGKTAFALNIAEHTALADENPVAIFSMEMSASSLAQRMISSLGRVNAHSIKTGQLEERDWNRVDGAIQQIKNAPIYIDDTPSLTPIELRARARRIQREKGLSLIVIDYLQLMSVHGNKENRATEISEISRNLKALARELNIPIIALSQLNRSVEQRTDKQPQMSDLRESGAIEQDADLIAFIYREEVYDPDTDKKGVALINVAKQRNGSIGQFNLTFLGRYTRFENWVPEYEQI
ncbi:MAG: replicative DNA helicase [Gammaproteobacteria bacterium]|jgi:replicative DNA helicase|nr:MAG: replicative DNA helicase [Gammaproteobacteria bacterium]